MSNTITEVDINKISSLAYLSVADDEKSPINNIYMYNNCKITVGQLIDYYQSDQGQQELKERFKGTIAGQGEYERWSGFLEELKNSDISNYKDWEITNVKSNNGPPDKADSLKLDEDGYYKDSGFVACVIKTDPDTAVVAFRGSEPLGDPKYFNDWQTDFRFAYQEETYQQSDAAQYMKDLATELDDIDNLYITGHSLGGNLALYATMNITDKLKPKLVSTTTFAAPGFNQDVLDKFGNIIAELTLEGKITEYQNYLDPVGSLLHNPTQAIYIDSINPSASPFDNHSSFLNVVNEDGKAFEQCDIQAKSDLCNAIHELTVEFDKLPFGSKHALVEWVLGIWQGTMESKSIGKKFIETTLLVVGISEALAMPTVVLGKIVAGALSIAIIGELQHLIEVSIKSVKQYMESLKEKIVETITLTLDAHPEIQALYNLLIGQFDEALKGFFKWAAQEIKKQKINSNGQYVKKLAQIWNTSGTLGNNEIEVDTDRLRELYNKLNKLYSEQKMNVRSIYTVAQNKAKMVNNKYTQSYVGQAVSRVVTLSRELEDCYENLNKNFQVIVNALKSAEKAYINEEKEICRKIR